MLLFVLLLVTKQCHPMHIDTELIHKTSRAHPDRRTERRVGKVTAGNLVAMARITRPCAGRKDKHKQAEVEGQN